MKIGILPKIFSSVNFQEILKFAVVGISGVVVNLGIYYSLTRFFSIRFEIASPIAIEISIISNFLLNNLWTFKDRITLNTFFNRIVKFHTVSLVSGLLNYLTFLSLIKFAGINDIIANLIGISAAVISNFILNSNWTWKRKHIG